MVNNISPMKLFGMDGRDLTNLLDYTKTSS